MYKVIVFSGAGISAESGLDTYRDENGLWSKYSHEEVASPEGWKADRNKVLEFWNSMRLKVVSAKPNLAHLALSEFESFCDVHIVTQNVDDLHERAGSTKVLHLHGEILKSRSSLDRNLVYDTAGKNINIGDRCEKGSQLRPHVVWFGEYVPLYESALELVKSADVIMVIGCSLEVYPAASLLSKRKKGSKLILIDPRAERGDYTVYRERATIGVPLAIHDLKNELS
ncbi:Sir2 family NAD-dependent protein deacetylase [Ketobacter alkanivorans]|uniref:protein acetyllysine N-acetyltransferase n=1 Tax=Ketobacter alkanivorans TaxID=1917421 RepID=A0A2K9LS28_9GAMM|nr:Sir2 family NAD-dependent protein deacetylase [Ketobacter alkanivorans]AUM15050.1 NAD-dependent deacylase [Ketobacter alkanivorans]